MKNDYNSYRWKKELQNFEETYIEKFTLDFLYQLSSDLCHFIIKNIIIF